MTDNTVWQAGRFAFDLRQPKIMGIVNLTPDSFSDGGTYSANRQDALRHAETLLRQGADILEWRRLAAVLPELVAWNVPLSIDTRRTVIMRCLLENGWADIINDVQALEDEGAPELLAQYSSVGICLMHMQGLPQSMQDNPSYHDVVPEVAAFLIGRVDLCSGAGIARQRLVLDPGFGFGKTLEHNTLLMRHLRG